MNIDSTLQFGGGVPGAYAGIKSRLSNQPDMVGFSYSIHVDDVPLTPEALIENGQDLAIPLYVRYPVQMKKWLYDQIAEHCYPDGFAVDKIGEASREPGRLYDSAWPSYTYRERMVGYQYAAMRALAVQPGNNRVVWPIYERSDAHRSGDPTRIPDTIAYQFITRPDGEKQNANRLHVVMSSSYCALTDLWLSDIFIAAEIVRYLCSLLYGYGKIGAVFPGTIFHSVGVFVK